LVVALSTLSSCAKVRAYLTACDVEVAPDSYVGLAGDDESASTTYCLSVPQSATLITVRIAVNIAAGKVAWTLTNPGGTVEWTHEEAGFGWTESSDQFEPVAGTWRFQVVTSDMRGGYYLIWTEGP
jgi:hypothetical protein